MEVRPPYSRNCLKLCCGSFAEALAGSMVCSNPPRQLVSFLQDYCRAVQPTDIQLLLPQFAALDDDPAFSMPPLGFNPTHSGLDDHDKEPSHVNGESADMNAHSSMRNFVRHSPSFTEAA